MSKKAEDYYKDLAKVDSAKTGFKPVAPARNSQQKGVIVPWGTVSFVAGCVGLFVAVKFLAHHDVSSVIGIMKGRVSMSSKTQTLSDTKSDQELPKVEAPKPVELVEIDGRYYKKTDDNIYYINGKRVYFVDNRGKAAAAPPASPAQKQ